MSQVCGQWSALSRLSLSVAANAGSIFLSISQFKGNSMGMNQRIEALPQGRFQKWGYGLQRIRHDEWQPRIDAVTIVLELLDGTREAARTPDVLNALSTVKGLFMRQYLGDQYDWFTTAKYTAYPAPQLCKAICSGLATVRGSLLNGDTKRVREGCDTLVNSCLPEMLDNYLSMAVHAKYPEPEKGFAYILFSTSEKALLHIGACDGEVEDVLKRLGSDYEGHDPYGVAVAYLVNDAEHAGELIKKALARNYVDDGFYRLDLKTARDRVEEVLYKAKEIVASPWHAEGEEPEMEQQALQLAVA
jgi:hypothetical protein